MTAGGPVSPPVAVVTGAARGIGRGTARAFARIGATVYVTDRETRAHRFSALPGTIEDTAEQVDQLGGRGVPYALDHSAPDRDERARALFATIVEEHGGLDILVANACNGNANPFRGGPFWTLPSDSWTTMVDVGVRSHVDTAGHAVDALVASHGLLVYTGFAVPGDTDGPLGGHLYYDLAMTAVSRLARTTAHDLTPHGVTALAVSPGFTRTEAITAALGAQPPGSDPLERPGRAVTAVFLDPARHRHAGRTLTVDEAASLYAAVDGEGSASPICPRPVQDSGDGRKGQALP